MSDICRLCDDVARHTCFCSSHDTGWVASEERQGIEWTDESSYYAAVDAYVIRYTARAQRTTEITEEVE